MKQILSTFVILFFLAGASYASFPVKNNSDKDATIETTENSEIAIEKDSKIEKKISKIATKIEKKMALEGGEKDNTIAIVLALVSVIFLPLGLHNWYLGRKNQALWQTLLVIPFGILIVPAVVSWVWQIVDLVRLLGGGLP